MLKDLVRLRFGRQPLYTVEQLLRSRTRGCGHGSPFFFPWGRSDPNPWGGGRRRLARSDLRVAPAPTYTPRHCSAVRTGAGRGSRASTLGPAFPVGQIFLSAQAELLTMSHYTLTQGRDGQARQDKERR